MYVYSPGARVDNPMGDKILIIPDRFATLSKHCKFQPLVSTTFLENDVLTFPTQNLMYRDENLTFL